MSAARREDYGQVALFNEIEAKIISKHVETRWLSMRKCLEIVAEQWPNLKKYFLEFIPKSGPNAKDVVSSERYKRLKTILAVDSNLIIFNAIAYIAKTLEDFLVPFQSKKPTSHLYHSKMEELLYKILSNFIKRSVVTKTEEKVTVRKSLRELADVLVENKSNHLELSKCHFGSSANNLIVKLLQEKDNNSEIIQKLTAALVEMYIKVTKSIQTKQPLKNEVLTWLQFIHPNLRAKPDSSMSIRKLALGIGTSLKNTNILKGHTPETYADKVVPMTWQILRSRKTLMPSGKR